ncbi:MAG: TIGR03086 family metal-binding protein [Actinomycetota bacterium]
MSESAPLTLERVIDATPDEAFALFTEPDRLRRWMALSVGLDLSIGGDVRMTVVPGSINRGTVMELEPGRRFVYSWGWDGNDDPAPGESVVAVDFEPVDGGTRVRLTHTGLSDAAAPGHGEGWNHYMDRLVLASATGDAGSDPWAIGGDEMDWLDCAEATWGICSQVLAVLTEEDAARPTPCADYSVAELVDHLAGSMVGLAKMADVEFEPSVGENFESRVADAVEPALAAWRARGLDGMLPFGDGEAPAALFSGIFSLEFLIHAWDFAHATGRTIEVAPHVLELVTDMAHQIIQPGFRGPDKGFAEIVTTDGSDPLEALVAFSGRRP